MAKEIKSTYKIIGAMAGSSMDGLDLAEVHFEKEEGRWDFTLLKSVTIPYDQEVYDMLANASHRPLKEQEEIDIRFGEWMGQQIRKFNLAGSDLVGLHGHTVLHNPGGGQSWQLGKGSVVANVTKSVVVSDFRSLDVTLGGQGAPLVPIGDFELFSGYDGCLNLGGIANVSVRDKKLAWDVCPCNQVLNQFAKKLGMAYDDEGKIARVDQPQTDWIEGLRELAFFSKKPPKSLPNEFLGSEVLNQLDARSGLSSYTHFITDQIVNDLAECLPSGSRVLTTGGGAFNKFLLHLLNENKKGLAFEVPDSSIVSFKEAIVFAFLGLLKAREEINVLASVTGAARDSSSGVIHYPK